MPRVGWGGGHKQQVVNSSRPALGPARGGVRQGAHATGRQLVPSCPGPCQGGIWLPARSLQHEDVENTLCLRICPGTFACDSACPATSKTDER
eukprot:15454124-Alexandrium_andersonii.AAC.2